MTKPSLNNSEQLRKESEALTIRGLTRASTLPTQSPTTPSFTQAPFNVTKKLYVMPSSPAIDLTYGILATGGVGFQTYARRREALSHGKTTIKTRMVPSKQMGEDPRLTGVLYTSGEVELQVDLLGVDKLMDSQGSVRKILKLVLAEANERGAFRGDGFEEIVFPISDLVDNGIYSHLSTAYKGFERAMDVLTGLRFKGKISAKGRKKGPAITWEPLFYGASVHDGQCHVRLGALPVRQLACQFFAPCPRLYFRLDTNAADLYNLIFRQARMKDGLKQIRQNKGTFYISNRLIQTTLNLPDPENAKNPSRDIKGVIMAAVEEIETKNADPSIGLGYAGFHLLPVIKDANGTHVPEGKRTNLQKYLDSGFLQVTLPQELVDGLLSSQKIGSPKKRSIGTKKKHETKGESPSKE